MEELPVARAETLIDLFKLGEKVSLCKTVESRVTVRHPDDMKDYMAAAPEWMNRCVQFNKDVIEVRPELRVFDFPRLSKALRSLCISEMYRSIEIFSHLISHCARCKDGVFALGWTSENGVDEDHIGLLKALFAKYYPLATMDVTVMESEVRVVCSMEDSPLPGE